MDFAGLRHRMVEEQLRARGIHDEAVLMAMEKVPRHLFVPPFVQEFSYADDPLPIASGQTISQPYIVAAMTELLHPHRGMRVLEIGTGSGYQAAVLAEIGVEVYTIETVEELGEEARELLQDLGYKNIHFKISDGYFGWPSSAPFDGILVTAASPEIPEPLVEQLKPGGVLVIPVGDAYAVQSLKMVKKVSERHLDIKDVGNVCFVPFQRHRPSA